MAAVAVAALVGVALPLHFFTAEPSGAVSHQVWAVSFKLAGAYLLAITSWVLVLAWAAVRLGRSIPRAENVTGSSLPETGDNARGNA